ncbi:hypothetical protein AB0L06_24925 [Spirillospora sp. NPDC052269]
MNAYQFAARHPDKVSKLIVEDIGAVVDSDWTFTTRFPSPAPSREALVAALGAVAPYLECSFRQDGQNWGYSFGIDDTETSQKALNGDHWDDWTSVSCPTLLIRGIRSDELAGYHARDMVARRPRPDGSSLSPPAASGPRRRRHEQRHSHPRGHL